jgi:tRNA pseudouridine38-40 synthase
MRLKLLVGYDGTPFAGWQSQPGGNTVQDILEAAIAAVQGTPTTVHGSGRTDAGVHALGQCAHADVTQSRMTPGQWLRALNTRLPQEIRILKATQAKPDFHARFSAKGKIYRYVIWNGPVLPPLELNRAWHVPRDLDRGALHTASQIFTGRHDFGAFCASRGKPDEDTHRTIHSIRVVRTGSKIQITFKGEGFLYKMVRMVAAAIVRAAQGSESVESLREMLASPGQKKSHHVAPAGGLYLVRVLY